MSGKAKKIPRWVTELEEPRCMFCGAAEGEVSQAGEHPGINRATAVYYCMTCNYLYCSVCSYRNESCAGDEAICVRCDSLIKRIIPPGIPGDTGRA